MICKTCGRVLSDADSFCPTCGATVESVQEQKDVVFQAPQRDFEWDVHSFPGDAPKPTEDTNFDWGISANEFRRRPDVEQIQPQQTQQPQQTVATQQPAQGQWQTYQQPAQQQSQAQQAVPQQQVQQAAPQAPQFEQQPQQPAQQTQQPAPQQPAQQASQQIPQGVAQQAAPQQQMNPQQPVQQAEQQVQQAAQQAQVQQPQTSQAEQQATEQVAEQVAAQQPQAPAPEEPKKSKGGFFARFKDRKMTVEQPVITDEMIAQAQREKLEAQKEELRAVADAERAAKQPVAEPQAAQQPQTLVQPEASQQPQTPVQPEVMRAPEQPASPTKKEHVEFDWNQPAPSAMPAQAEQAQPQAPQHEQQNQQAQPAPQQQPAPEQPMSQPEQPAPKQDEQAQQQVKSSSVPEAVFTQNELKADRPSDITGEALERELFGGAAVTGMVDGGEGLSRQTARIDQFYTFNRKNEEFQKLLDDEYDKFRAGKPLDNSTFAANVEAIKERDLERMIPRVDGPEVAFDNRQTSVFMPISDEPVAVDEDYEDPDKKAATAAMAIASSPVIADEEKIREMFGTSTGEKAAEKQSEELTEEQAKQKAKEEAAEQKRLKKEAKEKAKREKKEQKARAKAEKAQAGKASGEAAQSGISAGEAAAAGAVLAGLGAAAAGAADATQAGSEGIDAVTAESQAADEAAKKAAKKEEQQSKIGKIIIIILSVILALLVIALGLKIIAPDSILSQKIDNIADSVMTVFTGDEEEQEPASVDDESREDFNSDLTGVIQESVDDNFNNLIAQVSYDPELTYEKKKNKYKDQDLKNSVPITDNVWYEQEDGKKLYLDEAIVKNVVRFESQWQSMIREGREAVLSLVDEDTKLYEEVDNSFETNPTSEFKQLDIGEIRRDKNDNYYVWVRETKDDDVKEKVYKIIDDQRNMQFVGYTQL